MLNFAVGPVQSSEEVRAIGAEQVPYFRTPEFSSVMLDNERMIKELAGAEAEARVVFLTGSGSAAMEAAVMNVFTPKDKLLVVNGGSFGQRFVELCQIYSIPFTEIKLAAGELLTAEHLAPYNKHNYTGFLVNLHETSTGVYYDIRLISKFCKENNLLLAVDAISTFLADPFDMEALGADVVIVSSQKALACPPGISMIILSGRVVERVSQNRVLSMYFDLKAALKNGERGQTPFTPAVSILLQINVRLNQIKNSGGAPGEIGRIKTLAQDFRTRVKHLPVEVASKSMSNAMTPLHPLNVSAYQVFQVLKDEYEIWVCPNGGELRDRIFRVGHLGALTIDDNTRLLEALEDMQRRSLL